MSAFATFWFEVIKVAATVIVGVAAVWIAYQQLQINKRKLFFDMYAPRLEVYKEVKSLLISVMRKWTVDKDEMMRFQRGTADADLLFGPEVVEFIAELVKHGWSLRLYNTDSSGALHLGVTQQKAAVQKDVEFRWFMLQLERSHDLFKKYLDVNAQ